MLALVGHTAQFLVFDGLIRVVDRVSRLPRSGVQPEVARLLRENLALKAQVRALTDELKKERGKRPNVSMTTRVSQVFAYLLTRGDKAFQNYYLSASRTTIERWAAKLRRGPWPQRQKTSGGRPPVPEVVVHDHGPNFLGQFERQLRVLEIEQQRTPTHLSFVNGIAERAVLSGRTEMLNHIRIRDDEELRWYLDEYRRDYNEHRAHQALGGQTPSALGEDTPQSKIISLDDVRRRKLLRRISANGLLNGDELVEEKAAA